MQTALPIPGHISASHNRKSNRFIGRGLSVEHLCVAKCGCFTLRAFDKLGSECRLDFYFSG